MSKFTTRGAAVPMLVLLAAALAMPSSASTNGPSGEDAMHVKRLVILEAGSHQVGSNAVVGSDLVRSRSSHRVVGYDSVTAKINTDTVTYWGAFALKGGIIEFRVEVPMEAPRVITAPISHGSGKYHDIEGTVRFVEARPIGDLLRSFVTIRYQL